MARAIAREFRARLPWSIELDDLEATGFLAVIQAVDTFDPTHPRRVPLRIWIKFKVRNAIIDAHKGRNYRWEFHLPLSDLRYYKFQRQQAEATHAKILRKQRLGLVAGAMRRLPSKERASLVRSAVGWRLAAIARQFHVTESAVCQIRKRAIARIQGTLGIPRTEKK